MTTKQPQQQYEIGMVGLGVMGRNLVLNMADHGFAVAGYDKDQAKVEALRQESKERGAVRVGSFGGLIFPNLALRLEPVLICLAIAAASLLVEFIGSLGDLRRQIGRCLGFMLQLPNLPLRLLPVLNCSTVLRAPASSYSS